MRRGRKPADPEDVAYATRVPLALTIFVLGVLAFGILSVTLPPLLDGLATAPVAETCWSSDIAAPMAVSAIPACTVLELRNLERLAAESLSHPDAGELAVARGGTTGQWLWALAQVGFNILVLVALVLGLFGLWATIAVRLSRRPLPPSRRMAGR